MLGKIVTVFARHFEDILVSVYLHKIVTRQSCLTWRISFLYLFKQEPRPLSESDLEKVVATSKKTQVAANEYNTLRSQFVGLSRHTDRDDYPVQAAISELSKLVVSQILNLQIDNQDS